jgi:predicted nucleic acid-binding Zn ribbon protein
VGRASSIGYDGGMGHDRSMLCDQCGKEMEPGRVVCYRCDNKLRKMAMGYRRAYLFWGWVWIVVGVFVVLLGTEKAFPESLKLAGCGLVPLATGWWFLHDRVRSAEEAARRWYLYLEYRRRLK